LASLVRIEKQKRPDARGAYLNPFAEEEGFEPPEPFGSTVFKTAAFDRSATPLSITGSTIAPVAVNLTSRHCSGLNRTANVADEGYLAKKAALILVPKLKKFTFCELFRTFNCTFHAGSFNKKGNN
jgi:hypothetical protein